jgi:cardiolipin synthase
MKTQIPSIRMNEGEPNDSFRFDLVAGYVRNFRRFQLADRTDLLVNGSETFTAMLDAIDDAKKFIDLETYILRSDRTGWMFQKALIKAAKRGVKVRLLYDYIGSLGLSERFVREMVEAGVEVRVYHPLIWIRPTWAINQRDHRKLMIVDGQYVFTGGINISNDFVSREEGGGGWRDTHIRIEGSMVADWAEQLYDYVWRKATAYHETTTPGSKLKAGFRRRFKKPMTIESLASMGGNIYDELRRNKKIAVQLIGNREVHRRKSIRSAYIHAINRAQRYVLIENAYFIPDRYIRDVLAKAVLRGVQVSVVVARNTDVPIAGYASRAMYSQLLKSGVRIFEWPKDMMHAKTAVIDDVWSVVGSFNLDHRSLRYQLELVAVVADPSFAKKLRQQTVMDIEKCEELTLERHEKRPWYERLLESIAYKFRYWL